MRKVARKPFAPRLESLESVCLLTTLAGPALGLTAHVQNSHAQPMDVQVSSITGSALGTAYMPRQVGVGAPSLLALRGAITVNGTQYHASTITGKFNNTIFPPSGSLALHAQGSELDLSFVQTNSTHASYQITGGKGVFASATGSGTFSFKIGTPSTRNLWSVPYRLTFG